MFKLKDKASLQGNPFSPGKPFFLLLTGALALMLAACGGGDGGNNGIASNQCTLTAEELETLTPDEVDALPAACDGLSIFDVPSIGGPDGKLFIVGTEVDGATGDLLLYVHGLKKNGSPMTLADFQLATVTLDGIAADPAATVAQASGDVLAMALLADYSTSITDTDLNALGGLYNTILSSAPAGFEAEIINFSTENLAPAITIKPGLAPPYWTEDLSALLAATAVDPTQPRENTPLYDAMGTGLLGPVDISDPSDGLGLVERGRPATLMVAQTDGKDTASLVLDLADITSLIESCRTTVIMLGTFRSEVDAQILDDLVGIRGAAVNALNTNFLEAAIGTFAESLGNLAVFTLTPGSSFAGKTVEISVGEVAASVAEPFDIGVSCQL